MRQYVILQLLVLLAQSMFGTVSTPAVLSQDQSRIKNEYDSEINQTIYVIDGVGYETEESYWSRIIPKGYVDIILKTCRKNNFSIAYAHTLVFHESGYNPRPSDKINKNGTSDHGLFQINEINIGSPHFNKVVLGISTNDQWDPYNDWDNANAGIRFLKYLGTQFSTPRQVLYAYNWGPGHTRAYLKGLRQPPTSTIRYTNNIIREATKLENDLSIYKYRVVPEDELFDLLDKIHTVELQNKYPIHIDNDRVLSNTVSNVLYPVNIKEKGWVDDIAYERNIERYTSQTILDTITSGEKDPSKKENIKGHSRTIAIREDYIVPETIECDRTWNDMLLNEFQYNIRNRLIS